MKVDLPFPRLTYAEAMRRYGTDKPDTRFAMELVDLSRALAGTEFTPYQNALDAGGQVKAINVKGGAKYSRKHLDELTEIAKRYGAGGMAWIKIAEIRRDHVFALESPGRRESRRTGSGSRLRGRRLRC